jgi:hypothetical protein
MVASGVGMTALGDSVGVLAVGSATACSRVGSAVCGGADVSPVLSLVLTTSDTKRTIPKLTAKSVKRMTPRATRRETVAGDEDVPEYSSVIRDGTNHYHDVHALKRKHTPVTLHLSLPLLP